MNCLQLKITRFTVDPVARSGRAVGIAVLAAGGEQAHRCGAEGAQSTQDGRDGSGRSLRQDLPAVQRPAHRQEKDTREETHPQSNFQ